MAKLLDPHVDLLLVAGSLGMVVWLLLDPADYVSAVIARRVVVRRAAVVMIDLPFATYQESPERAYRNAVDGRNRRGR